MAGNIQIGEPQLFLGITKLSWFFAILMLGFSGYFLYWGLDYTNHNQVVIFILATLFGLFMAFNIGGNDVANSFGTSVGAGTLSIKQALVVAAVFEISGAVIAGGEVTETIRSGIVDLSTVNVAPMEFVYIMMSALLAAAVWLLIATRRGWPVSTTHCIIGGIVGGSMTLGALLHGTDTAYALVQWGKIGEITVSWILSPLLGGLVSFSLFSLIKKYILAYNQQANTAINALKDERRDLRDRHKKAFERLSEIQKLAYNSAMNRDAALKTSPGYDPEDLESDYYRELHKLEQRANSLSAYWALENWVPIIASVGAMIITSMVLFKGLHNIDLKLGTLNDFLIMAMVGAGTWLAIFVFAKTLKGKDLDRSTFLLFSWMQVFTASGFAFSHGSNDIANAIGPFAAIIDVLRTGEVGHSAAIPPIAMITFGVALIVGLWFIGKEVIKTVGHNLTEMHPASGFSAELSAAAVVMIASMLGLPVSSTHILIGAVLGVGIVNRNANWQLMKPILLAWILTLPAAASIAAVCFMVLRGVF